MIKKIIFIALILFLVSTIAYWRLFSAPQLRATNSSILFKIAAGENLQTISDNLENTGLIRSARAFSLFAKVRLLDRNIKKGRYQLQADMNVQEILRVITEKRNTEISVTIPEGFSVRGIDERLAQKGLIEASEFAVRAQTLEGYLFPDTYFVTNADDLVESLISKMQNNFLKKLTPNLLAEIERKKRTIQEVITMASIIEKEVKTEKDYPIVAGILWKRLDNDWPLQADATLLYGRESQIITEKELKENNLYNTRNRRGLPPTPIGNPGIATIHAAIFPEESKYWFYLTDREGNVHYARTNEEHNENRKKYL